jgi:hypothetical protein
MFKVGNTRIEIIKIVEWLNSKRDREETSDTKSQRRVIEINWREGIAINISEEGIAFTVRCMWGFAIRNWITIAISLIVIRES